MPSKPHDEPADSLQADNQERHKNNLADAAMPLDSSAPNSPTQMVSPFIHPSVTAFDSAKDSVILGRNAVKESPLRRLLPESQLEESYFASRIDPSQPILSQRNFSNKRNNLIKSHLKVPRKSNDDSSESPLTNESDTSERSDHAVSPQFSEPSSNYLSRFGLSFVQFLRTELEHDEHKETESRYLIQKERVSNFLSVPIALEKLLIFGYLVCLDAYLAVFTIFPLRIIRYLYIYLKSLFYPRSHKLLVYQKCELIRASLLLTCCYFFSFIDSSRLYHSIRGQAVIKLYVIFNVLEIGDRLCCSFGQDILDSLLSRFSIINDKKPGENSPKSQDKNLLRPLPHFILAIFYIFAHTMILFYQVITLNVAINSHNNALFTLLISNQFVEIKGSVFKKFEKENLFQVSCSDIVERFQLGIFLLVISMRNYLELNADWSMFSGEYSIPIISEIWRVLLVKYSRSPTLFSFLVDSLISSLTYFTSTLPLAIYDFLVQPFSVSLDFGSYIGLFDAILFPVVVIYLSEVVIDWLKHAFITKFNQIRPSVYGKYLDILCKDYLTGRNGNLDGALGNHSSYVARRLGFATLPLACLIIRVSYQTASMMGWVWCDESTNWLSCSSKLTVGWSALFIFLFLLKFSLGKFLFTFSKHRCDTIKDRRSSDPSNNNNNNNNNRRRSKTPSHSERRSRFSQYVLGGNDQMEREKLIHKDEADIVDDGNIKLPTDSAVSLENISRYELYKSRIP